MVGTAHLTTMLRALVMLLVLGRLGLAQPAETDLDRARAAIARIELHEAYRLLERALQSGTSSRRELVEIYRLRGELAAALGDGEAAREHFRRLLALEPGVTSTRDDSPKITRWLAEARAIAVTLDVRFDVSRADPDRATITIDVIGDVTGLVAGARASYRDPAGTSRSVVGTEPGPLSLELPAPGTTVRVVIVDRFGNRLVEQELGIPPPTPRSTPGTPAYAHPAIWAGATAAAALTTGVLLVLTHSAQNDLDRLRSAPADHEITDAEAAARTLRRRALATNIGLGVTVVATTVTALTYWRLRSRRIQIAVTPDPSAPMIVLRLER